jgi:hypothetical protein
MVELREEWELAWRGNREAFCETEPGRAASRFDRPFALALDWASAVRKASEVTPVAEVQWTGETAVETSAGVAEAELGRRLPGGGPGGGAERGRETRVALDANDDGVGPACAERSGDDRDGHHERGGEEGAHARA